MSDCTSTMLCRNKGKLSDLNDVSDASFELELSKGVVDKLDGELTACCAEIKDFKRRKSPEDSEYILTTEAECGKIAETLTTSPNAVGPNEQSTTFSECPNNYHQPTNSLSTSDPDVIFVATFESEANNTHNEHDSASSKQSSTDVTYVHEELDYNVSQIRLLTLEPASTKEADIYCSLKLASLGREDQERPTYEALSYTWGEQQRKCIIYVNNRPFRVTSNLDIALRYLRKTFESRVLWIDAICIDQSSPEEKTHQVQRMAEIYQNASQVVVWLGESDSNICKVMGLFKRLEKPVRARAGNRESLSGFLNVLRHSEWRCGLQKIFTKSWWSRIWVVQEVAVAKRPPLVGCGHDWASWLVFGTVLLYLAEDPLFFKSGFLQNSRAAVEFGSFLGGTGNLRDIYQEKQPKSRDLEGLLLATSDRDSSQPHDKVFALLGLLEQSGLNDLTPNYNQPCVVVYQKAMVHVLNSAPDLHFLIESMNRKRLHVPSWCVDFSQPNWNTYTNTLELSMCEKKGTLLASAKVRKGPIVHDCQEGTLEVSGCTIGIIEGVAIPVRAKLDFMKQVTSENIASLPLAEIDRMFLNICKQVSSNGEKLLLQAGGKFQYRCGKATEHQTRIESNKRKVPHESVDVLEARETWKTFNQKAWQTLNGGERLETNCLYVSSSIQAVAPYLKQFSLSDTMGYHFTGRSKTIDLLTERSKELKTQIFNSGVELVDQTLFTTDTGHLGKAPTAINAVQKGDVICILHGCHLPAVLRAVGHRYKVITFAYVSDVMDGELFDDGVERESRRFVLC